MKFADMFVITIITISSFTQTAFAVERPSPEDPPSTTKIKTWIEPVTKMKFVWIKGDCFQMGQSPSETRLLKREFSIQDYKKYYADELPEHKVCLGGFWMGIHEVTQGEWRKIMGYNPANFNVSDNYPVDMVSWDDTQEFIKKLNILSEEKQFRLPTEAEWEYGSRAGADSEMYHTGETITPEQANFNGSIPFGMNLKQDYRKSPTPVDTFPPNKFGLHDMHGNVWEWCNDWYKEKYYEKAPDTNPVGPDTGAMRVLRGGSWFRYAGHIRSATRYKNRQTGQFADTGFRLVKSPVYLSKDSDRPIRFDPDF